MMVRVLHIVTIMDRGGLENRLMDIYRNIDRNRIQFDFYTCRKEKGYFDDEIVKMGGHVYYDESLSVARLFSIPVRFEKFLKNHSEYKIVHCHMNSWCGLILKGAKEAGVPVRIAHARAATQGKSLQIAIKNIIKLPVNRFSTHRFAVSKKAGVWLFGENPVSEGKVQIFPNAIECKKFEFRPQIREEMRVRLGIDDDLAIIHVGNLNPVKNHAFLLQVFAALKKRKTFVKLILVGRDGMHGSIHQLARQLGIDGDVIFLGERSDVPALLQAGDVFVFPSLYEGFPGAVLEAQAAGLPCVISDTITDEVCITSECIQLSLSESPTEWASKVLELGGGTRRNNYKFLCDCGYDINSLVKNMQDFYIEASQCDYGRG
jgi:glycosyltransferase involved in cell wall biosynthesis